MVYGVVKNGVVQLEGASSLHEGTRVRIEPVETDALEAGTAQAILSRLQPWSGNDNELRALEDAVQKMRDDDLANSDSQGL